MRRRDRLTRKERREFDGLVKCFFEQEAPDPQAPSPGPPGGARTPDRRRRIDPRHPSAGRDPES
jgi:hypothetical protein